MRVRLGVDVAAPAQVAWDELVDLEAWPRWGPTVTSASLDGGGTRLHEGASGTVRTVLGVGLPFRVDGWRTGEVRAWSWRVAGVRATEHLVLERGPTRCRVEMTVPWWATAYVGVVGLALRAIRRRAEATARGGGDLAG